MSDSFPWFLVKYLLAKYKHRAFYMKHSRWLCQALCLFFLAKMIIYL